MPEAVVAKARGRTGIESDSDLIQTALAILDDSITEAIHANSAKLDLARFTSRVLQSGVELPSYQEQHR
jgi:hypothetical protein